MSESRQRFTGVFVQVGCVFVFLWLLFVTLPFFTSYLHVSAVDPRWLTPEDLTWQRLLFNFLSKPGFRLIIVGVIGSLLLMLIGLVSGEKSQKRKGIGPIPMRTSFSVEWVMDNGKNGSLSEYGRFVGVI